MKSPRFGKLVTSLRTAVEKGEGDLDKEATSYDDIFDRYKLTQKILSDKINEIAN